MTGELWVQWKITDFTDFTDQHGGGGMEKLPVNRCAAAI